MFAEKCFVVYKLALKTIHNNVLQNILNNSSISEIQGEHSEGQHSFGHKFQCILFHGHAS